MFLTLTGCHHGVYRASSLPPELAAPQGVALDSFPLTRLGPCVAGDDMIHPGDKLQVTLSAGDESDSSTNEEIEVAEDGSLAVPFVGPLHVAGLTPLAAAYAIREASMRRGVYVNPAASLAFAERKMNQVTVMGAVQKPGTHQLPAGSSSLTAALVAAGGISEGASPIVEIQNPAPHGMPAGSGPLGANSGPVWLNLLDVLATPGSAASSIDQHLNHGAIVTVLEEPKRYITVMGLTGNQIMPLPPGRPIRLLDALAKAGGPKYSIWIADRMKVIRRLPGSDETVTIGASIRKAKKDHSENILLAANDIISVEENPITFTIDTVNALLGVGLAAARVGTGGY
ncbi:MAG: polysaccharide biosynthesis/export family protein [Planctomycetes bacterium]|nr:polysaccharide biosynthesis/export family protein [Planctomycetota bacterium]MBL7040616.1 polysaccharide biosynthesis/export family protein [Pirellulaceae bacterium]